MRAVMMEMMRHAERVLDVLHKGQSAGGAISPE